MLEAWRTSEPEKRTLQYRAGATSENEYEYE